MPATIEQTLRALEKQEGFDAAEVILADGTANGGNEVADGQFPWIRRLRLEGASLPLLRRAALRAARGDIAAMLDPHDAPEAGWIREIERGLSDDRVFAVGGTVAFDGPSTAANRAAYLFEYAAFQPPLRGGRTEMDLPGNNVAYRRAFLTETCAELLEREGFYKPFFHEEIRARGRELHVLPSMRVRHLTSYRFLPFATSRFHHGRYFGARRRHRIHRRWLYIGLAPAIPLVLVFRHVTRSLLHARRRKLLGGGAGGQLAGICLFWGVGEWLGCWFGAGRSASEVC